MLLSFIVFCLISIIKNGSSLKTIDGVGKKLRNCFDGICLPNDYNKLTRPYEESGVTKVGIDFNVSQISEIDDNRC
jgi:hypothetical protein